MEIELTDIRIMYMDIGIGLIGEEVTDDLIKLGILSELYSNCRTNKQLRNTLKDYYQDGLPSDLVRYLYQEFNIPKKEIRQKGHEYIDYLMEYEPEK